MKFSTFKPPLVHIVKTKDTVSIKLFFGGVSTFLVAFIMWNLGKDKQTKLIYWLNKHKQTSSL